LALIPVMMMLSGCLGNLPGSETAKASAVCGDTKQVRTAHAGALLKLGASPEEKTAKATGATALAAIAAGCNEV